MDEASSTQIHAHAGASNRSHCWQDALLAELRDASVRRAWGPALMAIGWIHLGSMLICQTLYSKKISTPWVFLLLWTLELAAVLGVMRAISGRDWIRQSAAVGLIARVWITFLILSFNVVSLNNLTGFTVDWFKPVWCSLASFGFATMAWLFGSRFLIPAFQMYFTGLLIHRFPQWGYLIHGLSWCVALQYLGNDLIRRRARHAQLGQVHGSSAYVSEPEPATAAA